MALALLWYSLLTVELKTNFNYIRKAVFPYLRPAGLVVSSFSKSITVKT